MELKRELALLVDQLRDHLTGGYASSPPLLIIHGAEGKAELKLLANLTAALSRRAHPAFMVDVHLFAHTPMEGLPVVTEEAQRLLPALEPAYLMRNLSQYVANPHLRKGLWEELCALI